MRKLAGLLAATAMMAATSDYHVIQPPQNATRVWGKSEMTKKQKAARAKSKAARKARRNQK